MYEHEITSVRYLGIAVFSAALIVMVVLVGMSLRRAVPQMQYTNAPGVCNAGNLDTCQNAGQ